MDEMIWDAINKGLISIEKMSCFSTLIERALETHSTKVSISLVSSVVMPTDRLDKVLCTRLADIGNEKFNLN